MVRKKIEATEMIKPLFLPVDKGFSINHLILQFAKDDYNKVIGETLIGAGNDAEAVAVFLQEYQDSPETLRSYAKEVERLLLWCIHVGQVNISSLRRAHLTKYQAFLKNPEPKKLWCGPSAARLKKDGSINALWRPFAGGLGASSIKKSIKILDSFFNYLVQTNYLIGNPLAVDRRRKRCNQTKSRIIDRYLELEEIQVTLDALSAYPIDDEKHVFQVIRARYIILLLFYSGLRIAEAAHHTMGNFIQREGHWFLRVIGKGKKLREIPVPDALRAALAEFRLKAGLPSSEPKYREKTPLIPMQNLQQPISTRRIDQILKWAFQQGASYFEPDHPQKASKLRQASAHWLRHSYVTYLLDSGAPLKVAQENAGHSDVSTTMHYRHVAQTDRFEATRHLSLIKSKIPSTNQEKA